MVLGIISFYKRVMCVISYRRLEPQDPELVKRLMEEYALQFPAFIINLYPERWASYIHHSSDSEYWVAVEMNQIVGHAGYMYNNDEKCYEIVGVVVSPRHLRKESGKLFWTMYVMRFKKEEKQKLCCTLSAILVMKIH